MSNEGTSGSRREMTLF